MSDVPAAGLRIREAARALVLAPGGFVLLVRFEFPTATVWALPGGGIEAGESATDAVRRELREEVGLTAPEIGSAIWRRLHVIPFLDGRWDGQREVVHLVPVPARFDPQPHLDWDELRSERMHALRWWHVDEVLARSAEGSAASARFAPRSLGEHLAALLRDGPPVEVVDVGV